MQCYREARPGHFLEANFFIWTTPTRRAYARRRATPGYMPRARVTSHRKTWIKKTPISCLSIDMPNGFFRRGIGGVSNSHPPSRARSGVVRVTHCELGSPPKMCFRSAERRCSRRHVHGEHPGREHYGGYDARITYGSHKPSSRASADLSGASVSRRWRMRRCRRAARARTASRPAGGA
jgi:hypothetical protein